MPRGFSEEAGVEALDVTHFKGLAHLGSFDPLIATVLPVQQSILVGSPELRQWALDC